MKGTISIDDVRRRSGYLFWKVSALWQRGIRYVLDPLGLTHTQYVLLASLRQREGASQAELSKHTGCDSMTVSAVVRTLAAKGWVNRQDNPEDRRAKLLRITAVGMALVDKAAPMIEAFDRRFFLDRLGSRREVFIRDLDRLAQD